MPSSAHTSGMQGLGTWHSKRERARLGKGCPNPQHCRCGVERLRDRRIARVCLLIA